MTGNSAVELALNALNHVKTVYSPYQEPIRIEELGEKPNDGSPSAYSLWEDATDVDHLYQYTIERYKVAKFNVNMVICFCKIYDIKN